MTTFGDDDMKRNVKDKDTWMRFVFLVLYCVILYITVGLTFLASFIQFLSKLFSGHTLEGVMHFGLNLAEYQKQMSRYLTYVSDDRPFPFAPFPDIAVPTVKDIVS